MKNLLTYLFTFFIFGMGYAQSLTFDPVLGQYVYFYQCSQPMVVLRATHVHNIDLTPINVGDTIYPAGIVIAIAQGDTFDFTCYIPPINSTAVCISGYAQLIRPLGITDNHFNGQLVVNHHIGLVDLQKPYFKRIYSLNGQLLREGKGLCVIRYEQRLNNVVYHAIECKYY